MLRPIVLLLMVMGSAGAATTAADADEDEDDFGPEGWRAAAYRARRGTVLIADDRCAGFLAHDRRTVLSAAHCVHRGERQLKVEFASGRIMNAEVRLVDDRADVAWLWLPSQAKEEPLVVRPELPTPGEQLVFTGSALRPSAQIVDVDRIGPCPSLPRLPETLFTSLQAIPGHSGAPVVDRAGKVTGMVHGGARCHILVPSTEFAEPLPKPRSRFSRAQSAPRRGEVRMGSSGSARQRRSLRRATGRR